MSDQSTIEPYSLNICNYRVIFGLTSPKNSHGIMHTFKVSIFHCLGILTIMHNILFAVFNSKFYSSSFTARIKVGYK